MAVQQIIPNNNCIFFTLYPVNGVDDDAITFFEICILSQTAKMLWFIVLYLSVFVPDIPGKRKLSFRVGKLSAVRQRTESIGFSPLRGSHRAARRQKYHYSVMALSYGEAVIHLPSTYRSFPQWEIIAFVTDVAHHHRNVTEECVFNFQGADARCCLACL